MLGIYWFAGGTLDALFLPPFSSLHVATEHLTIFPRFPGLALCPFLQVITVIWCHATDRALGMANWPM
jgi:hypothetical protein